MAPYKRRLPGRTSARTRAELAQQAATIIALASTGRKTDIADSLLLSQEEVQRLLRQFEVQIQTASKFGKKMRARYIEGVAYGILIGA